MTDWHAIVTEHGPVVWRAAYRLLGDEESARDCYQETFLAAMRVAESGPIKNWQAMLRTIATRKAIDSLRARIRQRSRVNGHADPQQLPAPGPASGRGSASPAAHERPAEEKEFVDAVRAALASISPRQAEAFALRHFEEMDNHEIAERLETNPRNVDVLVHRAAAKLQDKLPASVLCDRISGATR